MKRLRYPVMKQRLTILSATFLLLTSVAVSQHCGGPCEVPRGADPVSPNPRYTLTEGPESANWRYLFNWFWTENGKPLHRVEKTLKALPCRDFGYRRMFVSPAGNGFLVTGNAYTQRKSQGKEPPLFVFCSPKGRRLVTVGLKEVAQAWELRKGPCPGCGAECCADMLYVFAREPHLSRNKAFVELELCGTGREIAFCLPLGVPVLDRDRFDGLLAEAQWASLDDGQRKAKRQEIAGWIRKLGSKNPAVNREASWRLRTYGYLARGPLKKAGAATESADLRRSLAAVVERLSPWNGRWQDMTRSLPLLSRLLSHPDAGVSETTLERVHRLLPDTAELSAPQAAQWIRKHRGELKWNEAAGHYQN